MTQPLKLTAWTLSLLSAVAPLCAKPATHAKAKPNKPATHAKSAPKAQFAADPKPMDEVKAVVAPTPTIILPAHTLVPVVVTNHLKSGQNKEGEQVVYKTFATVYGPHHEILIPKGSQGYGTVTESKRCGMAGKGGKLKFTCDYVLTGANTHVAFSNADLSKQGRTYNAFTMYVVGGAFLLLAKGRNIDVEEGAPFIMDVAADTPITPMPEGEAAPVTIVPSKRKAKSYSATITGFGVDSITITTDKGESQINLKDVKQILLPN